MILCCLVVGLFLSTTKGATVKPPSIAKVFNSAVLEEKAFVANLHRNTLTKECRVISFQQAPFILRHEDGLLVRSKGPVKVLHDDSAGKQSIWEMVEIASRDKNKVEEKFQQVCPNSTLEQVSADEETYPIKPENLISLVQSGNSSNRVDLLMLGDGYTQEQFDLFKSDMMFLVNGEMFNGETFKSYLPLFNIWAYFTPSKESGIGRNGKTKDTVFGLFRPGTEYRLIDTSKEDVARNICSQLSKEGKCDYKLIIANDDYYGGQGGEFIISTKSVTSGTVVLRHEMGHTMAEVGEEYDGGSAYFGANSISSVKNTAAWTQWTPGSTLHEEINALRIQQYAWYELNKGPYTIPFKSDGKMSRWLLKISVTGADTPASFEIYLDGKRLPWTTSGTKDRSFYVWANDTQGFSAGNHSLEFRAGKVAITTDANDVPPLQLCSINLVEYANSYPKAENVISAFPTYGEWGMKRFRPTDESCVMRNMTQTQFCSICKESIWDNFLRYFRPIDGVKVDRIGLSRLSAKLGLAGGNNYPQTLITWKHGDVVIPEIQNKSEWTLDIQPGWEAEKWSVEVNFATPEIRKLKNGSSTKDVLQFSINS